MTESLERRAEELIRVLRDSRYELSGYGRVQDAAQVIEQLLSENRQVREIVEHVWYSVLEYHSHNPDPKYAEDINIPGWYNIPRGYDGGPGRKLWRLLREYKGVNA